MADSRFDTRAFDNVRLAEQLYVTYCEEFENACENNTPKQYIQRIAEIACDRLLDEKSEEPYQKTRNRICGFVSAVNIEVVVRSRAFIATQESKANLFVCNISDNYAKWAEEILKKRLHMTSPEKAEEPDDDFVSVAKPKSTTEQSSNTPGFLAAALGLAAFGVFYCCRETGMLSTSNEKRGPKPPPPKPF